MKSKLLIAILLLAACESPPEITEEIVATAEPVEAEPLACDTVDTRCVQKHELTLCFEIAKCNRLPTLLDRPQRCAPVAVRDGFYFCTWDTP